MLICLGCDRESEGPASRGFCVLCTKENMRLNGVSCSLGEILNCGPAMVNNPHLIVRLTVK